MNNNLFKIDFNVTFPSRSYKGLLNKLKTFVSYCATVGIHQADGKKKVIRRYNAGEWNKETRTRGKKYNKKGKQIFSMAGKSHRMNVIKLAYQNEFGAKILIKPRYKTVTTKSKQIFHTKSFRIKRKQTTIASELFEKKGAGYLLLNKEGKFVKYYKPNSEISIPARPFLTKVLKNKNKKTVDVINKILVHTFVSRKYTASKAINIIAKYVSILAKINVLNNNNANSQITVKAKGFNDPLTDEQNRIYKSIKYKVYKNSNIPGVSGHKMLQSQMKKQLDKSLKSIADFEKIIEQTTNDTKIFKYKNGNKHYQEYFNNLSDSELTDYLNVLSELRPKLQ